MSTAASAVAVTFCERSPWAPAPFSSAGRWPGVSRPGGAQRAERVLAGLTLELAEALALAGATSPDEVGPDLVRHGVSN
jgi:hypothetical protein